MRSCHPAMELIYWFYKITSRTTKHTSQYLSHHKDTSKKRDVLHQQPTQSTEPGQPLLQIINIQNITFYKWTKSDADQVTQSDDTPVNWWLDGGQNPTCQLARLGSLWCLDSCCLVSQRADKEMMGWRHCQFSHTAYEPWLRTMTVEVWARAKMNLMKWQKPQSRTSTALYTAKCLYWRTGLLGQAPSNVPTQMDCTDQWSKGITSWIDLTIRRRTY